MKSPEEKNRKRNPQQIQVPEHDKPGRIMSPPPFDLTASTIGVQKRKEDEEEAIEGKEGKEQQ